MSQVEHTLDAAIAEAAEELASGKAGPLATEAPEATEEVANDNVGEVEPEVEVEAEAEPTSEELSDPELTEAKNLYKLLKNKESAAPIIAALAQQIGLLKPENLPETRKETREAVKTVKDMVIEGLGDEYKFMSSKLGDVIEKVLETKIQEARQEQIQYAERQEQKELLSEVEKVRSKLNNETKGDFDRLEPRILELMNQFEPSATQDVESYIRGIYTIATAGRSRAIAQKNLSDKIKRNSNDAASRLASVGTGGKGSEISGPTKKGVGAAVEYALGQLQKG